ncbi:MAG: leucine-rich repeat domain-containing protein, partial [Geminicoccaceae bacterium]
MREAYGGGVDFAHNTLRDFLAGQAFASEPGGVGELAKNIGDQAWHRPAIFAASDRQHDVAEKLIKALMRKNTRMAKIIASLCDVSVTYLDPDLRDRVTKLRDDFLPPRNLDEAELIAALGDAIVDRRLLCKGPKVTAHACARTLRLIGTDKAKEVLRFYWESQQQEIAEELAQVFNPLAIPFWQAWVQREFSLPEGVQSSFDDTAILAGLANLRALSLTNARVDDIAPLAGLANLQTLLLSNTRVDDIATLAGLANLQGRGLTNTRVDDIATLAGLTNLQELYLDNTRVDDIATLAGLANLRTLGLTNTRVDDIAPLAGLASLASLQRLY